MSGLTNNPNDFRRSSETGRLCKWCLHTHSVLNTFFQASVKVCERCGMLWETVKEEDVPGIMRVWEERSEDECQAEATLSG